MGRHLFILSSIVLLLFLTTFPCFIEAAEKCDSFKKCTPIANWQLNAKDTGEKASKNCDDACAGYFCVVNGAVIYGGGCYSDYKATCTGSTAATRNIDTSHSLILDGTKKETGNFVHVCKNVVGNCVLGIGGIEFAVNFNNDFFAKDFIGGVTSNPDGCSAPPPPNEGLMNQMNGFKLFGIILIGFAFAQF
uniref:Uncharacterized protein n=1 Tax=Panagrolaimus sp. ES5 TaxID=591445 RepID=A0AC34FN77_9BILA